MVSDKLVYYLKAWTLAAPQPLAQTVTSHVYTVTHEGTRAVLKLLTEVGEEERAGAVALRHYNGHGAVRLLRADENAHLLEYADGENLVGMVKRGDDAQATAIIGDVLNQLHAAPKTFPDGLYTLKRWFRELFRKADADRRAGLHSVYVRAAGIAEGVLDDPRDVCVLHGDMHHENVRWREGRGWLAFDPKGLVGEKTYDAANVLCNPMDMPDLVENEARILSTAGILGEKMGVDPGRILTFTFMYTCLSASWYASSGEDPSDDLRMAALVEPHVRF